MSCPAKSEIKLKKKELETEWVNVGTAFTFMQELEKRLRRDLREEWASTPPTHENAGSIPNEYELKMSLDDSIDRLIASVPVHNISSLSKTSRIYPRPRQSLQPLPLNDHERNALHFLQNLGARLENPFTLRQFKKIRRELFLKYHPDHGGGTQLFLLIQENLFILQNFFRRNFSNIAN